MKVIDLHIVVGIKENKYRFTQTVDLDVKVEQEIIKILDKAGCLSTQA